MPTRTNQNGTFRPERFASSPVFDRALKANLVAARCSVLESAEQREICWFIQYLSLHAGGLRWLAVEVAPDHLNEAESVKWLASLCVDPATNLDLGIAMPALKRLMADYTRQKAEGVAVSEIGQAINEALNYCSQVHGLVIVSGKPRLGKTWAAQHWVGQHPGRARLVQVPSAGDDLAFFSAIASALGITVESDAKTNRLRHRIEAALQPESVFLVLDEAAMCWPGYDYRLSRPSRISWLMTGIINRGCSLALLVTPQFFASQEAYVHKSGWAAQQWDGRVSRYIALPDSLPISDLESIARAWLPHGCKRSIEMLADVANISVRGVAAIEHTVKSAIYFAGLDGRKEADLKDIQRAIKTGVLPSDTNLAMAIESATARRKTPANGSRR